MRNGRLSRRGLPPTAREIPYLSDGDAKGWAQRHIFGIDKDRINVKLTIAIMLIIGDGSTHIYPGDSLRSVICGKNIIPTCWQ